MSSDFALSAALIEESVMPPATEAVAVPPADHLTHAELITAFNQQGIKWVPVAPFPAFMVFYRMDDDSEDGEMKKLMRLLPLWEPTTDCNGRATQYFTENGTFLVLIGWRYQGQYGVPIPLIQRICILNHEVHHAINFVLDHVGQQPDVENDEFTAYMHEYYLNAALVAVGFGESDLWRTNTGI